MRHPKKWRYGICKRQLGLYVRQTNRDFWRAENKLVMHKFCKVLLYPSFISGEWNWNFKPAFLLRSLISCAGILFPSYLTIQLRCGAWDELLACLRVIKRSPTNIRHKCSCRHFFLIYFINTLFFIWCFCHVQRFATEFKMPPGACNAMGNLYHCSKGLRSKINVTLFFLFLHLR